MGILKDPTQLGFYIASLERWAMLSARTGTDEELQGELVLAIAVKQNPELCKEMSEHFGIKLRDEKSGISKITAWLKEKFGINKHADMIKTLNTFLNTTKMKTETLIDFIVRFEKNYAEVKKMGESLSPTCLAIMLLRQAQLSDTDSHIITINLEFDPKAEGADRNLEKMKTAMKKFQHTKMANHQPHNHGNQSGKPVAAYITALAEAENLDDDQMDDMLTYLTAVKQRGGGGGGGNGGYKGGFKGGRYQNYKGFWKCDYCCCTIHPRYKPCDCPCSTHTKENCPKPDPAVKAAYLKRKAEQDEEKKAKKSKGNQDNQQPAKEKQYITYDHYEQQPDDESDYEKSLMARDITEKESNVYQPLAALHHALGTVPAGASSSHPGNSTGQLPTESQQYKDCRHSTRAAGHQSQVDIRDVKTAPANYHLSGITRIPRSEHHSEEDGDLEDGQPGDGDDEYQARKIIVGLPSYLALSDSSSKSEVQESEEQDDDENRDEMMRMMKEMKMLRDMPRQPGDPHWVKENGEFQDPDGQYDGYEEMMENRRVIKGKKVDHTIKFQSNPEAEKEKKSKYHPPAAENIEEMMRTKMTEMRMLINMPRQQGDPYWVQENGDFRDPDGNYDGYAEMIEHRRVVMGKRLDSTTVHQSPPASAEQNREKIFLRGSEGQNWQQAALTNKELHELFILLDCGSPSTIVGLENFRAIMQQYSEMMQNTFVYEESNKHYEFGGGEATFSMGRAKLPDYLLDQDQQAHLVYIWVEILNQKYLPLLFGGRSLFKSNSTLCFKTLTLSLDWEEERLVLPIKQADTGHFHLQFLSMPTQEDQTKLSKTKMPEAAQQSDENHTKQEVLYTEDIPKEEVWDWECEAEFGRFFEENGVFDEDVNASYTDSDLDSNVSLVSDHRLPSQTEVGSDFYTESVDGEDSNEGLIPSEYSSSDSSVEMILEDITPEYRRDAADTVTLAEMTAWIRRNHPDLDEMYELGIINGYEIDDNGVASYTIDAENIRYSEAVVVMRDDDEAGEVEDSVAPSVQNYDGLVQPDLVLPGIDGASAQVRDQSVPAEHISDTLHTEEHRERSVFDIDDPKPVEDIVYSLISDDENEGEDKERSIFDIDNPKPMKDIVYNLVSEDEDEDEKGNHNTEQCYIINVKQAKGRLTSMTSSNAMVNKIFNNTMMPDKMMFNNVKVNKMHNNKMMSIKVMPNNVMINKTSNNTMMSIKARSGNVMISKMSSNAMMFVKMMSGNMMTNKMINNIMKNEVFNIDAMKADSEVDEKNNDTNESNSELQADQQEGPAPDGPPSPANSTNNSTADPGHGQEDHNNQEINVNNKEGVAAKKKELRDFNNHGVCEMMNKSDTTAPNIGQQQGSGPYSDVTEPGRSY